MRTWRSSRSILCVQWCRKVNSLWRVLDSRLLLINECLHICHLIICNFFQASASFERKANVGEEREQERKELLLNSSWICFLFRCEILNGSLYFLFDHHQLIGCHLKTSSDDVCSRRHALRQKKILCRIYWIRLRWGRLFIAWLILVINYHNYGVNESAVPQRQLTML